ncbi:flavodoxin-dependent (E)-4-hydroxy-3-methylbut-2-enyl-diphosphate synthase [Stutzerimonas xanthomarina]|uniref:flavodoxin-dependent (E)-4-hydroxy-3-methylbut-2-enyl-diphosphate synthase n=1 Tax=Stutzerimonas xanthomarina TaxID=271420 RepID=UPI003AA8E301
MAVEAYRLLAGQIEQPLHLGITEAVTVQPVKSAVGLGMLLAEGIATPFACRWRPTLSRKSGRLRYLKSLRLRSRGINFIACPSCSRQNFDVVKTMNSLKPWKTCWYRWTLP